MFQQPVLDLVQRREIAVAAFGRQHADRAVLAQQDRHAEAGAGANHRDHTVFRQRPFRPGDVQQMIVIHRSHGMGDRLEIIQQNMAVQLQLAVDQRGPDDPGIVGKFDHLDADRRGDGDGGVARHRLVQRGAISLPGDLQAGMIGGAHLGGLAQ